MNNWEILGYIKGSKYRVQVVKALSSGPKTPKELAEITGLRINHISRTLRELREKEIIECKTPNLKKGRIYVLSEKGQDILSDLS